MTEQPSSSSAPDSASPSRVSSRVLTALVGIPIVAAILVVGGWLLAGVALLLAVVAMRELIAATRDSTAQVLGLGLGLMLVVFYAVFSLGLRTLGIENAPLFSLEAIVALFTLATLLWAIVTYNSAQKPSLLSISLTVFAALYVALFAFIPTLQNLPHGHALLWLTLLCVWTGDTIAYYAGRAWGKTKLTPLSPGKSREGALCGFVATVIVGTAIGAFNTSSIGLIHGALLGAFVGIFAPLGDLAESFWKRELGVKDLGAILPGHGGVLDRCDSLLFAAPVVYFYARHFLAT